MKTITTGALIGLCILLCGCSDKQKKKDEPPTKVAVFSHTLVFQGFDFEDKTELREKLKSAGVDTDAIEERSVDDSARFEFIVSTKMTLGELRDQLQDLMEEEWGEIEIRQPGEDTLMYVKGR